MKKKKGKLKSLVARTLGGVTGSSSSSSELTLLGKVQIKKRQKIHSDQNLQFQQFLWEWIKVRIRSIRPEHSTVDDSKQPHTGHWMKTQKSERVSKSDTLHAHSSDQLRDHFNEETEQIRLFHSREPFSWQRLPITGNHWTLQQSFCFLRTTCYDHRNQSAQTVKLSPCTPSAPGPGVTSSSFMFLRKRSQIWKLINFKKGFLASNTSGEHPA